jgi:hypothetical protein
MNKIVITCLFLLSFNLVAEEGGISPFGRIIELKGSGFISHGGKTKEIRKGDVIQLNSEIVIEHSGQVTFTDNADHRFYLGNSSSAYVKNNSVTLRDGDMWFQSLNKDDTFKIQTANAGIDYQGGEAIITYDSLKGRTQLMVINGLMKLSNLRNSELNLSVSESHFSFVENSYEDGMPRDPTPVGEKTYAQLVSLFSGVAPMDKNAAKLFKDEKAEVAATHEKTEKAHEEHAVERKIASVVTPDDSKIIEEYKNSLLNKHSKMKQARKSAPVQVESHAKATRATSKTVAKKHEAQTVTIVHIYGQKQASESKTTSEVKTEIAAVVGAKTRAPASVLEENVSVEENAPASVNPFVKDGNDFSKESNKLIDDLKKL